MDNPQIPQMQQLASMALQQYGMQHQASMYQPRFGLSNLMASGTGQFSFAQSMGQNFGGAGGQIGMMADLVLPIMLGNDYTQFMQRLNLGSNPGTLLQQAQARQFQSTVSQLGSTDLGALISTEFNVAPGSTIDEFIRGGAPILDLLSGGAISNIGRMIDPTMMTQQGAFGVIEAQRRMTRMGELDSAEADLLEAPDAGSHVDRYRRRPPHLHARLPSRLGW